MNENKILHLMGDSLDSMIQNHHIYDELRNLHKKYRSINVEMKELVYDYTFQSLNPDYYHQMMEKYSKEKCQLKELIFPRKEEIQKLRFVTENDGEQELLINKYIEKINIDYMMQAFEPIYTKEYERILKYVF